MEFKNKWHEANYKKMIARRKAEKVQRVKAARAEAKAKQIAERKRAAEYAEFLRKEELTTPSWGKQYGRWGSK